MQLKPGMTLPLLFAPLKGTKLIVPFSLEKNIYFIYSEIQIFRYFKIQHIPIWDSSTSLSVQLYMHVLQFQRPRGESVLQAARRCAGASYTSLFEIGMSNIFFSFLFFSFAGDIYS